MAPWQRALSAPGAILMGGLAFWALAWFIDFWTHVERFGIAEGAHAHGGEALVRLNLPITGLPLVVIGLALLMGTEAVLKRGGLPLFLASLLLMVDGLAHAFAFNDHLGEPASAAFFALVAPAQVSAGVALPFVARRYDRAVMASAAGLLALYALSRTLHVPALAWPEPVEALDVVSKAAEVMLLGALLSVARSTAAHGAGPPARATDIPQGEPGP